MDSSVRLSAAVVVALLVVPASPSLAAAAESAPTTDEPTEDVVFRKTVITMKQAEPSACQPIMRGMTDFASKARVSADGKHCCIDRIVLRAQGVPATTMTP